MHPGVISHVWSHILLEVEKEEVKKITVPKKEDQATETNWKNGPAACTRPLA